MGSNLKPQISIITTTRNRAGFISLAIESIQNQTFTDWELIILDDDSTDNTREIVDKYVAKDSRIKYYKNSPALGISSNRNRGLTLASGKYMAVLDSDDFWLEKDKLQKQYDFLEQNPDYVLIGSNIKIIDEKGNFIKETTFASDDADIRKRILQNNQIPHSSVLIRKEAIEKVNGYDNKFSCVEDLDLFLKLGRFGKFKNLPEITTAYTRHSGGYSHQRKMAMAGNHLKIVWKNFGNYPRWLVAIIWAKIRLLKSLI